MLFSWILVIIVSTTLTNSQNYQITLFEKNPGLFYEKLNTVRFVQTFWRLTVFIDLGKLQKNLPIESLTREIDSIFARCATPYTEPCDQAIRPHILQEKISQASNILQDATDLLTDLKNTPINLENLPLTIKKRRSPLDFIGQGLKPVIGILTTEDGEAYDEAIDELYELNRNLSYLIGQQTHVIRSDLEKLHDEADRHTKVLNYIRNNLKQLNTLTETLNKKQYYAYLAQWTQTLESKLDHFIHATQEIIKIILSAREGKLHPTLLSNKQLQDIKTRLQTINKDYVFPIQGSRILAEEISKLAKTKIGYHNEKLLVVIDIPLLNKNIYKLYRIHSYPIPQNLKSQNYSAYIIPETPYIVISDDRRSFIYMNQESMNTCLKTDTYYICYDQQPIFETNALQTCESQLLLDPSEKLWNICDIRIKANTKTYWKQVPTLGGWLFSTPHEEVITIACANDYEKRLKISGFGLLRLGNSCVARSSCVTLTSTTIQDTGIEYLYQPDLTLNISMITPNITDSDNLLLLNEFLLKDELFQQTKWDDLSEGTPLAQLENQLNKLSTHQRQEHSNFHRKLVQALTTIGIFAGMFTTYYIIQMVKVHRK